MDARGRKLFREAESIFRKFWPDPATYLQMDTAHRVCGTSSPGLQP
jgi:hypothetical protein